MVHSNEAMVTNDTLEKWKSEQGDSYTSPYDGNVNMYYEQSIESDAREFADLN